jgi:hypothetical protein
MKWPLYSLDLNPIENIWAILKAEIYRRYPELKEALNIVETLGKLIVCAIETWNSLEKDLLDQFIDTMTYRVQAVLDANGRYTKY